jgi:hypothetical protein
VRPTPYLPFCKSLQPSNRRVTTSGKCSPLAHSAHDWLPIAADPREKLNLDTPSTTWHSFISHTVANLHFFLSFTLPVGCTVSLTLLSIGASRAESFTPSKLSFFPTDWSFVQISQSSNHVLLRTAGMAGSCAASLVGAATTAFQIWYATQNSRRRHTF